MAKIATRVAFGEALAKLGEQNDKILVFDADLSTCTMTCYFGNKFPDRFFNCGIQEANMVNMAAGASTNGYTCFAATFAMFAAGRCYDQIRNTVAYPGLNVKVVGTHAGLSVGEDGATHQCIEDLSLMRTIPGMTVICPADGYEAEQAVFALAELNGPAYLRLGRSAIDQVTGGEGYKFEIGKAAKLREGKDVTIIANGITVQMALQAAETLQAEGISARVLDMHTIKPIDREAIIAAANETGLIVTSEEHNVVGGLGSAVAEVVTEMEKPVRVLKVGVQDEFGRSGNADALLKLYGVSAEAIVEKVKKGLGK